MRPEIGIQVLRRLALLTMRDGEPVVHSFAKDDVWIGTSVRADLRFRDPTMLPMHMRILFDRGRWRLRNSESSRGDRRRLPVDLSSGMLLDVGEQRFTVVEEFEFAPGCRSYRMQGLVGQSPQMLKLMHVLSIFARETCPVLINGASGTGKELVAQALHDLSGRRLESFLPINCGAIPGAIADSELFGYERGAFTGARTNRDGIFASVDGGTLFLDEVADLPMDVQGKLLRTLENGEIRRLGSFSTQTVDVRIVAATNKSMADDRTFRQDLLYRLNGCRLHIVGLHQRPADLEPLIHHFLGKRAQHALSPEALNLLRSYHWPGNVRELKTVLKRATIIAGKRRLEASDLGIACNLRFDACVLAQVGVTLSDMTSLVMSLRRNRTNRSAASRELKMARSTFYYKLGKLRDVLVKAQRLDLLKELRLNGD